MQAKQKRGWMQSRARLQRIDRQDVHKAYRRWAPIYDLAFGRLVDQGIKAAAGRLNRLNGRLLEVGVGTGLALPYYGPQLKVTGIDMSPDMLQRARKRVADGGLGNVEALLEMDATAMTFADGSFDAAVAAYVMTVVPDPERVMHEVARVLKPGGQLIVVSHFSVDKGVRGMVEKAISRHASRIGWRPEFPVETLLAGNRLKLVSRREIKPFGLFTLLEFVKQD
jgi:phosphatidylethanolamine/phosphatidyl-N-methylethanolamine N-methyltransferase